MIVLIDNYDSFSYNVYQLIGSVKPDIKVVRNDEVTIKELDSSPSRARSSRHRRDQSYHERFLARQDSSSEA